jgi:KTSC domain
MQRERVDSSSLSSVGYDAGSETLEVEFRNGGVYRYLEVPEDEWQSLQSAESKGSYLNTHIKPRHPYRKLAPPRKGRRG